MVALLSVRYLRHQLRVGGGGHGVRGRGAALPRQVKYYFVMRRINKYE